MTADDAIAWLRSLPTTAPEGRLRLERHGERADLVLDHDTARNALTTRMMQDLADAVEALEAQPPRLWVLRAEGRAFCAGGHLGDVRAHLATPEGGLRMATAMASLIARLEALPAVGLTLVHGAAVGGGAELAATGDVCLLGPQARVAFVQGLRGVAPGWGGAARLVRRVGAGTALEMLVDGAARSGAALAAVGFGRVSDDPLADAQRWEDHLTALPLPVVRALVRQVREPAAEAQAFATVWGSTQHREALAALPWGRR